MDAPAYFTPEASERLRVRLAEALAEYKRVCESNPEAAEAGDNSVWHDNFAFEENQRRMHMLARRVHELELLTKRAVVISAPIAPAEVTIGCRVGFRFEDERTVRRCELASYDDGGMEAGRISYNSPLGQALLGARVGDLIDVTLGVRARVIEVLDISGAEAPGCPV